ncbi:MAG: hypothetical protein GTO03_06215 [Planctomycetales bacterium]|nr:hypothetical protein [Planctomycetales bacterium]
MSDPQPARRPPALVRKVAEGGARLVDHTRALVLVPLLVVVVLAGGYWLARTAGRVGLGSADYQLAPDRIQLCTSSPWVDPQRLTASVIQDASLDRPLSILDPQLTERIALAFAQHPWVAEVARVEKFHPARVEVDLVYRTPVAVVVAGQQRVLVDQVGVPLPATDLPGPPQDALPTILGIDAPRRHVFGSAVGDPQVAGAAQIAAALRSSWSWLGLAAIVPAATTANGGQAFAYELVTRQGTRIGWGRQGGTPQEGEATAEEKSRWLQRYFRVHGTLEGLSHDGQVGEKGRLGSLPRAEPRQ